MLVVALNEDSTTGALKPVIIVVPTDAAGLEYTKMEMDIISADRQFSVFLDDVRLPADALVGAEDAAIDQLFAGLNPERIMASAFAVGMARYALGVATEYAKERVVWRDKPIGSHQGVAHPLAQAHIEVQLAKLMMQKAATLYDQGDHMGAGEAANMAKYAAGEAGARAVDQAVQTLGGNGLASEYGLGALIAVSKLSRIAPVSREMILNFVDTSPSTDPSAADAPLGLRHDADLIATLTLDSPENRNALIPGWSEISPCTFATSRPTTPFAPSCSSTRPTPSVPVPTSPRALARADRPRGGWRVWLRCCARSSS